VEDAELPEDCAAVVIDLFTGEPVGGVEGVHTA
jgi:hypothetical protein